MKAVWVDAGNDPQWETLAAHRITWVYVALSDPAVDVRRRILEIRRRGLKAGVYAAWNWYGNISGPAFAEEVDRQLKIVAPDATPSWPKVQLDDEEHDPDRIRGELRRWRELRPTTDTSWTMESMQGGWMPPEMVAEIVSLRVRVVPQCYAGDMRPVDTLTAARDLTKRGFPDSLITPFYDAAQLPIGWEGWAFTMGRLPT